MKSITNQTKHYSKWKKSYNWDTCKLNRKEYGQFLASFAERSENGLVLNLNGGWGTGKTEFIKRLYTEFRERKYASVYIDAWESDFSNDPLLAICSELTNQLINQNDGLGDDLDKILPIMGRLFKGAVVGASALVSHKLLGDANLGKELAEGAMGDGISYENYAKKLDGNFQSQLNAIYDVKANLLALSETLARFGFKDKVVVLIDELDRCRPNYAIEVLEVIKHFFCMPNFIFIIATDTSELIHSVKAVYGQNFDSDKYLSRFFDRRAKLPTPQILDYLNARDIDIGLPNDQVMFLPQGTNGKSINLYIAYICNAFSLRLRDIDQLLAQLKATIGAAIIKAENQGKIQIVNLIVLIVGLIEFDKKINTFDIRDDFKSYQENTIHGMSNTKQHDIFKDVYPFNFIKDNFKFIEQVRDKGKHLGFETLKIRRATAYEFDQIRTDLNRSGVNSEGYRSVFDELIRGLESYNTTEDKYSFWTWSSYKSAIELAGHIE